MNDQSNLEELEDLTRNLEFRTLVICRNNNCFEIPGVVGKVRAFTIYRDEKISIAKSFGNKGTILQFHSHSGKEWFGPISGKIKLTFKDGEALILEEGQAYEIHDERSHRCEYLEDTWLWLVTYPPEFPITEEKS